MAGSSSVEGNLHLDTYLTNYSENYVQEAGAFISQTCATTIPVLNQTDKYVVYDRGYFWRDEAAPRPLGGRPVQVGYKLSDGTYSCEEIALEHKIDDRQRKNTDDPIQLDQSATTLLTQKQMIRGDRIWATNFFTTGKWTTELTGVGSGPGANQFLQFNDPTSDPIGVIDDAKDLMHEKTGFMPNTLVLGAKVKKALRSHPDIADRIKYTRTGIADENILSALFEVDTIKTARSIYNSAREGATNSFNYIIDKYAAWLGYIEPQPALGSPTAILNFAWVGLIPGATNKQGGVMQKGREDLAHSDVFQNRTAYDMRIGAQDLGVWLGATVATS